MWNISPTLPMHSCWWRRRLWNTLQIAHPRNRIFMWEFNGEAKRIPFFVILMRPRDCCKEVTSLTFWCRWRVSSFAQIPFRVILLCHFVIFCICSIKISCGQQLQCIPLMYHKMTHWVSYSADTLLYCWTTRFNSHLHISTHQQLLLGHPLVSN